MFDDIFNGMFREFEEIERRMTQAFNDQKNGVKTYGYVTYRGPDGQTHTREFGNTAPALSMPDDGGFFADVSQEGNIVRAVADIPGASKDDIDLSCTDSTMTISANVRGRKLSRTLALPCDIKPESAKADFNNGVLEVTADSKNGSTTGHRIQIN